MEDDLEDHEIDVLSPEQFAKWLLADLQAYGGMMSEQAINAVLRRIGAAQDQEV